MNVSLPDEMRDFVERQVREGAFSTSSEYIRGLIRRDEARVRLHDLLREGLASPEVGEADAKYFAGKRRRARATVRPR